MRLRISKQWSAGLAHTQVSRVQLPTRSSFMKTPLPPCEHCSAYCCKQRGHDFAVLLEEHEVERFDQACLVRDVVPNLGITDSEWCLPYKDGKCVYLGDDDKCTIYESRPERCREFNCVNGYKCKGEYHSYFLEDHPEVVKLIELHVINTETS